MVRVKFGTFQASDEVGRAPERCQIGILVVVRKGYFDITWLS